MLIKTRLHRFTNKVYETAHGLWVASMDLVVPKHHNILAIVSGPQGRVLHAAHNIVTDAGDIYYAEQMVDGTPTNAFNSLYLSSVTWTVLNKTSTSTNIASMIAGTEKSVDGTYPQVSDGDTDNTGAGGDVATWRFSYAKGDFNDTDIEGGAISTASVPAWGSGGTVVLSAFNLTSFAKTANDTLKMFINHTANGV